MNKRHAIHPSASVRAAVLAAAVLAAVAGPASAQQAQSRLTPLIVHPGAEGLGSTLRLRHERLDLSTITREYSSMQVGRELVQGESVTRLRPQKASSGDPTERERRQKVIREQDDLRHKRSAFYFND